MISIFFQITAARTTTFRSTMHSPCKAFTIQLETLWLGAWALWSSTLYSTVILLIEITWDILLSWQCLLRWANIDTFIYRNMLIVILAKDMHWRQFHSFINTLILHLHIDCLEIWSCLLLSRSFFSRSIFAVISAIFIVRFLE